MRITALWKTLIAALALGAAMNAAAGLFGLGGTSWQEEARQPDGSKIVVERNVVRKGRREIGQPPPIGEQTLTFTMPGSAERLQWKDPYSEELGGASFNPMLLGVAQGIAYVLAAPAGCLAYNKYGRPNPPYVVFGFRDRTWQRLPLHALPAEFTKPNLIISSPDDEAEKIGKRLIPADMVDRANQGFRQPEYQSILREPMKNAGGSCGEMVHDGKGGWIGIGWFKKQPSLAACLKYCEREGVASQYCPCETLFGGK